MRQRQAAPTSATDGTGIAEGSTMPRSEKPSVEKEDEDHHHDEPIDDAKLDSLLWELMKFCIPIGFVLWLSIYLMYRNQFSTWSERVPGRVISSDPFPGDRAHDDGKQGLDEWIKRAGKVAWREIVNNVGPAVGAKDGAVVASPSAGEWEDEPDYYYSWTRDSALTMLTISSRFLPSMYLKPWLYNQSNPVSKGGFDVPSDNAKDALIEPLIRDYVHFQQHLQMVTTRSGDLWTGGLNEPKFHVDGTAFDGEWGRPQIDGPALRAFALIPYAHFLLDRAHPADTAYVRDNLYDPTQIRQAGKVIKNDLEEVAGGWWATGFDLWEEVDGQHLFTLLASYRALQAGAILARRLEDIGAADFYSTQADMLSNRLLDFRHDDGIWRATIYDAARDADAEEEANAEGQIGQHAPLRRTGLDCALPLATVHFGDGAGEQADGFSDGLSFDDQLQSASDEALGTVHAYILTFAGLYKINDGRNWTQGWAVGRYAEDVYNGVGTSRGNPWFICTFTVAEQLYTAARTLSTRSAIHVSNTSAPFWTDILGMPVEGGDTLPISVDDRLGSFSGNLLRMLPLINRGETRGRAGIRRLVEVADAFMQVGRRYAGDGDRMSEQFHRSDGALTGARDLTWSYASFLEAADARHRAQAAGDLGEGRRD